MTSEQKVDLIKTMIEHFYDTPSCDEDHAMGWIDSIYEITRYECDQENC